MRLLKSDRCRSFHVHNFGCRASQADGAAIESALLGKGMCPADLTEAELVVLNTCTVTALADQDVRKAVHRVHRENPGARILVTGCYAQRAPEELVVLPGVHWVVGNSHKVEIPGDCLPIPRRPIMARFTWANFRYPRISCPRLWKTRPAIERAPISKSRTAATIAVPSASFRSCAAGAAVRRRIR